MPAEQSLMYENPSPSAGAPKVSREIFRIIVPLIILAVGFGGYFGLLYSRDAPEAIVKHKTAPLVETIPIQAYAGGIDIELDGLVVPHREVRISAEVDGRIKRKAAICKAGNYVKEGTLLIEIDPMDYSLEVRRLTKELEQAKVTLTELDVEIANTRKLVDVATQDLEVQKREVARLQGLVDERAVTESQYDQALRGELTARNALLQTRNQLRLLETRRNRFQHALELVATQLEQAQVDEKRTKIFSPLDGVIVEEAAEQDSYVQRGTHLFSVEDTSAVEVKCSLRMDELYWLWRQDTQAVDLTRAPMEKGYEIPKTPATVIYELAGKQFAWDGVLSRYEGIGLDEKTRTVPCRIRVESPRSVRVLNPSGTLTGAVGPPALIRGMYVSIVLHASPTASLLKIPSLAVRPGNVIWLVEEGKLRRISIHVAQILRDGVLVEAARVDFDSGARVVVSPLAHSHEGMAVTEKVAS